MSVEQIVTKLQKILSWRMQNSLTTMAALAQRLKKFASNFVNMCRIKTV
jgi:hypothetical protein